MIIASTDFLEAQNANAIYSRVAGTIYTKNGQTYNIDEKNIIPNSLSIQNKCLNGSCFEYGAVYCAEMNISLKLDNIDRYSLFDATVELFYYLRLANGTEEAVKLGKWIVAEPTRTKKVVALKCYDVMTNFDKDIEVDTFGTAYELLNFCCENCNVGLGSTESEINALINSSDNLYCYTNEIATYRDLIAYISIITATFATIDRDGLLRLVKFDKEPVKTIQANKIVSSTICDYTTYYAGVEGRFLANKNYAPYDYENIDSTGLMLNIGDIPIVYGDNVYKNKLLENIYTTDLSLINYTPCALDIVTDATLELGDMIRIDNVNGTQDSINAIITSITFSHHNTMKIESAGSNPKLQTSSKTEKAISALSGKDKDDNSLVIFPYTNVSKLTLGAENTNIISIKYTSITETIVEFKATIVINAQPENEASELTITYKSNNIEVTDHVPIATLPKGNHIITLYYFLPNIESNTLNRFEVYASVGNGVATVNKGQIVATISGQGLSTIEPSWDGRIDIEDKFKTINIHGINVESIKEEVFAAVQKPTSPLFAETIRSIAISGVNVIGFADELAVNPITDKTTINTTTDNTLYSIYVTTDNAVFELNAEYSISSGPLIIDTGHLTVCNVDLTQFSEVQSLDIDVDSITYEYNTWNDVLEYSYKQLQDKTWSSVLRKES